MKLSCSVVRRSQDDEIATREMGMLKFSAVAVVAALVALAAAEGSLSCPAEDVTFELVTGQVFRSPGDILGWAHSSPCQF